MAAAQMATTAAMCETLSLTCARWGLHSYLVKVNNSGGHMQNDNNCRYLSFSEPPVPPNPPSPAYVSEQCILDGLKILYSRIKFWKSVVAFFVTDERMISVMWDEDLIEGVAIVRCEGSIVGIMGPHGLGYRWAKFEPDLELVSLLTVSKNNVTIEGTLEPSPDLFTFRRKEVKEPTAFAIIMFLSSTIAFCSMWFKDDVLSEQYLTPMGAIVSIVAGPYWPGIIHWACEALGALCACMSGVAVTRKRTRTGLFLQAMELPLVVLVPTALGKWARLGNIVVYALLVAPLHGLVYVRERAGDPIYWSLVVGRVATRPFYEHYDRNENEPDQPLGRNAFNRRNIDGNDDAAMCGFSLRDMVLQRIGLAVPSNWDRPGIQWSAALFGRVFLGGLILMVDLVCLSFWGFFCYFGTFSAFLWESAFGVGRIKRSIQIRVLSLELFLGICSVWMCLVALLHAINFFPVNVKFNTTKIASDRFFTPEIVNAFIWGSAVYVGFACIGEIWWRDQPSDCQILGDWLDQLIRQITPPGAVSFANQHRQEYTVTGWGTFEPGDSRFGFRARSIGKVRVPATTFYKYYNGEVVTIADGISVPACGRVYGGLPLNGCVLSTTDVSKPVSFVGGSMPANPI